MTIYTRKGLMTLHLVTSGYDDRGYAELNIFGMVWTEGSDLTVFQSQGVVLRLVQRTRLDCQFFGLG